MKKGQAPAAEREKPTTDKAKSVRFTVVVANAGKPELYLPLFDPNKDRAFMRAVKEQRVLSIRQEPTSPRSDFGTVGFDEQKYTTLLIFPKPLAAFADARIIGIKYDMVGESRVAAKAPLGSQKPRPRRVQKPPAAVRSRVSPSPRPVVPKPPEPPKRVEPQPKGYRVRVRVTTVAEKDLMVQATTKGEAKKKAQGVAQGEGTVRVVSVREV
jgi:hypothetical protein